jgi:hypothetical protein
MIGGNEHGLGTHLAIRSDIDPSTTLEHTASIYERSIAYSQGAAFDPLTLANIERADIQTARPVEHGP